MSGSLSTRSSHPVGVGLLSLAFIALLFAACAPGAPADERWDLGDAPDPSFPTLVDGGDGPALQARDGAGEYETAVVLGECASEEAQPKSSDDCDDGQPLIQTGTDFHIPIHRTGTADAGEYWINVVVDLDNDGSWDPDNEWLVRNCPVDVTGTPNETVQCPTAGSTLLSPAPGWMRVLVADRPAPADGWDGSAFSPPGEALGEVEDHLPEPPPTSVPPTKTPSAPTATPPSGDAGAGSEGVLHEDPADDTALLDADGNELGEAPAGNRADIRQVELQWVEIEGKRFLRVRVVRNKSDESNSSAVQVWLVRGEGDQATSIAVPFWELHEGTQTQGLGTAEGPVTYPGLMIEVTENGGVIEFLIPEALVGESTHAHIFSFDRVLATDDRGFDRTEALPLPPR